MEFFDSLNVYQNLQTISADTPELLVEAIRAVRVPMTIISVVAYANGNKHVAYVITDQTLKSSRNQKLQKIKGA